MAEFALRSPDLEVPLNPALARRLLSGADGIRVECRGFAWWPRPRHGDRIWLRKRQVGDRLRTGELVLVELDERLRLLRVRSDDGTNLELIADFEAAPTIALARERVLARSGRSSLVERAVACRRLAPWTELAMDLRRARQSNWPTPPGESVRIKYDYQASAYARGPVGILPEARAWFESIPRGRRVLIGGTGTGGDLAAAREAGLIGVGGDFALAMLAFARHRGPAVALDLLAPPFRDQTFAGIYLTPEVYSFLPGRERRVEALRRWRRLLEPGGSIFFAPREANGAREVLLCWLRRMVRPDLAPELGDWCSTWLDRAGDVHHSFVHVFRAGEVESEVRAAGLALIRRGSLFLATPAVLGSAVNGNGAARS